MVSITVLSLLLSIQRPDTGLAAEVRIALATAPIEVFEKDTGHVSVTGILVLDVGGQEAPLAFAWIVPSFRQTPTVLVYRRGPSGELQRVTEGLAPGRLQPLSGRLRDAHTLGQAADLTVGHGEPVDTMKFISAAIGQRMSVARYHGFFHLDMRLGFAGYVDLSDRTLPPTDTATCGSFESAESMPSRGGDLLATVCRRTSLRCRRRISPSTE